MTSAVSYRIGWQVWAGASGAAVLAAMIFVFSSAASSPVLGLGAVAAVIVCVGLFLSPPVSVALVALSLPLERIGRLNEDFSTFTVSLSRFVGLLALAAFLIYAFIRKKRIKMGLPFYLYAGYTLFAVAGISWALQEKDAVRDSMRILGNLLFFFLVVNFLRSRKLIILGIICWLIGTVGSGVYAVYSYHFGQTDPVEESAMGSTARRFTAVVDDAAEESALGGKVKRVYGTTSHPGVFGVNLVMTLPFFGWLYRRSRGLVKLLCLAGFGIVCYSIILSNTRFVFVIAAIALVWSVAVGLWGLRPASLAGIAMALICVFPLIPQDVYMRSLDPSLYSASKSDSIRIRFKMLDKSLELLEDHWLLGIGVGNQDIIPAMITDELGGRITPDGLKASAHNEFVWSAVEVGLFGWILHWSFVAVIIVTSFRCAARLKRDPERRDEYWLLVSAQIVLFLIPCFGIQSEVFHYSLKGWWFIAGATWVMWDTVRSVKAVSEVVYATAA
jgi:hypothetical protein